MPQRRPRHAPSAPSNLTVESPSAPITIPSAACLLSESIRRSYIPGAAHIRTNVSTYRSANTAEMGRAWFVVNQEHGRGESTVAFASR
jgi:hypothetical protein